jgi:hypothetical protein
MNWLESDEWMMGCASHVDRSITGGISWLAGGHASTPVNHAKNNIELQLLVAATTSMAVVAATTSKNEKKKPSFSRAALRSDEGYLCRPPRPLPSIPPLPPQGNNGNMFEEQIYAPNSSSSRIELSERIRPWTRRDDGACGGGGICGCEAGGV